MFLFQVWLALRGLISETIHFNDPLPRPCRLLSFYHRATSCFWLILPPLDLPTWFNSNIVFLMLRTAATQPSGPNWIRSLSNGSQFGMDLSLGLVPSLSPEVINSSFFAGCTSLWYQNKPTTRSLGTSVRWGIMAIPSVTINDESVIYNQNVREGLPWWPNAGGAGSIPSGKTKIPHTAEATKLHSPTLEKPALTTRRIPCHREETASPNKDPTHPKKKSGR